jgi:hypothetical protein
MPSESVAEGGGRERGLERGIRRGVEEQKRSVKQDETREGNCYIDKGDKGEKKD